VIVEEIIRTLYISRVLAMPLEDAADAFDRLAFQRADGSGRWTVWLPAVAMDVLGGIAPIEPPRPGIVWAARRADARLRTGLHRIPVELEILPWSQEATEIGLRPLARPGFGLATWEPYLRAGIHAMDALARAMHGARAIRSRSA
jgi:hypothetical protein